MTRRELDRRFAALQREHDLLILMFVAAIHHHGPLTIKQAFLEQERRNRAWRLRTDPAPDGHGAILTAELRSLTDDPMPHVLH